MLIFHLEPASGAGVGLGSGKFRFPNYDVFTLCESFLRNSRYCGYGQQFLYCRPFSGKVTILTRFVDFR